MICNLEQANWSCGSDRYSGFHHRPAARSLSCVRLGCDINMRDWASAGLLGSCPRLHLSLPAPFFGSCIHLVSPSISSPYCLPLLPPSSQPPHPFHTDFSSPSLMSCSFFSILHTQTQQLSDAAAVTQHHSSVSIWSLRNVSYSAAILMSKSQ